MSDKMPPPFLNFEQMCWPNPDDPNEIQWRIRHAPESMTRSDQLVAASVMEAYAFLINMSARDRQQRVMQIRAERDRLRALYPEDGDTDATH